MKMFVYTVQSCIYYVKIKDFLFTFDEFGFDDQTVHKLFPKMSALKLNFTEILKKSTSRFLAPQDTIKVIGGHIMSFLTFGEEWKFWI